MTSAEILAIPPGPALDLAVHQYCLGGIGDPLPYSTSEADAVKILDRLSLFVGRVSPQHSRFDPNRPYVAGTLVFDQATGGDTSRIRVTAATRMIALCKAALIVVLQPAKLDKKTAAQTAQEKARELAARVGTPGARSVAAGIKAAEAAKQKRSAAAVLKEQRESKKAARLLKKAGVVAPEQVSRPAKNSDLPVRTGPAQPGVASRTPRQLQPMPARPKEFIEPKKINTGGSERGAAAPV